MLFRISPYSVRMRENMDRINPNTDTFYAVIIKANTAIMPHSQTNRVSTRSVLEISHGKTLTPAA